MSIKYIFKRKPSPNALAYATGKVKRARLFFDSTSDFFEAENDAKDPMLSARFSHPFADRLKYK